MKRPRDNLRGLADRATAAAFTAAVRARRRIRRNPHLDRLYHRAVNRGVFRHGVVHDTLLANALRMDGYARAIRATVKPGDVVVDVGTGTGILACMAARQGARRVIGIDHNPINVARALAAHNGLDQVEFEQVHSGEFDPGEPVDVLLHEQIGMLIFDERMVSNLAELRDRVLRPGGRVVPNRFDVFLEPVELHADKVTPLLWEHRLEGLDFKGLREIAISNDEYPGFAAVRPDAVKRFLGQPAPTMTFDLEHDGPSDLPRAIAYRRQCAEDGVQHGFAFYFETPMDETTDITNAPLAPQSSWATPLLRTETRVRRHGEWITFELRAESLEDPESWHWTVSSESLVAPQG